MQEGYEITAFGQSTWIGTLDEKKACRLLKSKGMPVGEVYSFASRKTSLFLFYGDNI